MSIETEINRISTNVSETLNAVSEMGGTVPENATSDDMANGVRSIPVGAKINDSTSSPTTTYSSQKIDSEISKLNQANAAQDNRLTKLEQTAPSGSGGLTVAQVNALNGMFKVAAYIKADISAEYNAFKTAFGIEDSGSTEPDVPEEPEKTLTGISATYSGGDVAVGTALTALTGIAVTATYSDGSTAIVTDYTLSGQIAEGSNTITVSYGGMTTTFAVTGVSESGGEDAGRNPFAGTWVEGFRLNSNGREYPTGHDKYDTTDYVECTSFSSVTISTEKTSNVGINAVCWYDADKTYMTGVGTGFVNANPESTYPPSHTYEKADGAVYCRLCVIGYENVTVTVN